MSAAWLRAVVLWLVLAAAGAVCIGDLINSGSSGSFHVTATFGDSCVIDFLVPGSTDQVSVTFEQVDLRPSSGGELAYAQLESIPFNSSRLAYLDTTLLVDQQLGPFVSTTDGMRILLDLEFTDPTGSGASKDELRFVSGTWATFGASSGVCGDGVMDPLLEACDDGNTLSADGCSSDCQTIELGYSCSPAGGPCASAACDNAATITQEQLLSFTVQQWESDVDVTSCNDPNTLGSAVHTAWYALQLPGFVCPPSTDFATMASGGANSKVQLYQDCPRSDSELFCVRDRASSRVMVRVLSEVGSPFFQHGIIAWTHTKHPGCVLTYLLSWTSNTSLLLATIGLSAAVALAIVLQSRATLQRTITAWHKLQAKVKEQKTAEQRDGADADGGAAAAATRKFSTDAASLEANAAAAGVLPTLASMTIYDPRYPPPPPPSYDDVADGTFQSMMASTQDAKTPGPAPSQLIRQMSQLDDEVAMAAAAADGNQVLLAVQSIGDRSHGSSVLRAPRDMSLVDADKFFRAQLPEAGRLAASDTPQIQVDIDGSWSRPLRRKSKADQEAWCSAMDKAAAGNALLAVRVLSLSPDNFSVLTAVFALADWFTDVLLIIAIGYTWSSGPDEAGVLFAPFLIAAVSMSLSMTMGAVRSVGMLNDFLINDPEFRESVIAKTNGSLALAQLALLGACNLEALGVIRAHIPRLGLSYRLRPASRSRLTVSSWLTTFIEDIPQFVVQIWLLVLLASVPSVIQIASLSTTATMFFVSGYRRYITWLEIRRMADLATREDRERVALMKNLPVTPAAVLQRAAEQNQGTGSASTIPDGMVRIVALLSTGRGGRVHPVDVEPGVSMFDLQRKLMPQRSATGSRRYRILSFCHGNNIDDKEATVADVAAHGRARPLTYLVASHKQADGAAGCAAGWVAVEDDRRYWAWRLAKAAASEDKRVSMLMLDRRYGEMNMLGRVEWRLATIWWLVSLGVVYYYDVIQYRKFTPLVYFPYELFACAFILVLLRLSSHEPLQYAIRQLDLSVLLAAILVPTLAMRRVVSLVRRIAPLPGLKYVLFLRTLHLTLVVACPAIRLAAMIISQGHTLTEVATSGDDFPEFPSNTGLIPLSLWLVYARIGLVLQAGRLLIEPCLGFACIHRPRRLYA